jgi:hypothetical protein
MMRAEALATDDGCVLLVLEQGGVGSKDLVHMHIKINRRQAENLHTSLSRILGKS